MFSRFFFPFGLFVTELANLYQPSNRRGGRGRNLDQVHAVLPRQLQGIVQRQDTEVFVVSVYDADFAGTNFAVNPKMRGGRRIA